MVAVRRIAPAFHFPVGPPYCKKVEAIWGFEKAKVLQITE